MRPPTDGEAFSAIEEEFFRAGDALDKNHSVAKVEIATKPQRSAWSRWFTRSPRPVTEPSIAENENT